MIKPKEIKYIVPEKTPLEEFKELLVKIRTLARYALSFICPSCKNRAIFINDICQKCGREFNTDQDYYKQIIGLINASL